MAQYGRAAVADGFGEGPERIALAQGAVVAIEDVEVILVLGVLPMRAHTWIIVAIAGEQEDVLTGGHVMKNAVPGIVRSGGAPIQPALRINHVQSSGRGDIPA